MIIGFNMRELYLYRRIREFERSGITRKSVSRIFRDDLLTEKIKQILYQKGGAAFLLQRESSSVDFYGVI